MLFLHGFLTFGTWHHQLEEFFENIVVAVDMRGYNLSDKPEEISSYSMPFNRRCKTVIEAFGEKECVLIGTRLLHGHLLIHIRSMSKFSDVCFTLIHL